MSELTIDRFGEGERIKRAAKLFEGFEFAPVIATRSDQPIERALSTVIGALGFRPDVGFALKLERGLKTVLEPKEFFGIEGVERVLSRGGIQALPAEQGPHMRPVLLFDVRVIVLFVDAATGKSDLGAAGSAEVQQVIVDEFFAVIGIEPTQTKGQARLNDLQCLDDGVLTFAIERDALGPTRKDVGGGERVEKVALEGVAAVSDGVDFQVTWRPDVMVEGTNGDHGFKQAARAGRGVEAALKRLLMCPGQDLI